MHSILPCLYYPLSGTVWHCWNLSSASPLAPSGLLDSTLPWSPRWVQHLWQWWNPWDCRFANVWKTFKAYTLFFCSFPPLSVTNCHVSPFGTKHLRISVSVVTGQPGWKQWFQAYQHILQHQIWLLVNVQYLYAKEWPLTLSTWVENCVRPWVTLPAKPHECTIIVTELCNPQPNYQEHRTCRTRFRSYKLIQIAGSNINPKKLRPSATICD